MFDTETGKDAGIVFYCINIITEFCKASYVCLLTYACFVFIFTKASFTKQVNIDSHLNNKKNTDKEKEKNKERKEKKGKRKIKEFNGK